MASSKSLDSPTCWRRGGLRYDPHDQRHRHAEVDESHRVAPAFFFVSAIELGVARWAMELVNWIIEVYIGPSIMG